MKEILREIKNNILVASESINSKGCVFNLNPKVKDIFDNGRIFLFPKGIYNMIIYNKEPILDMTYLDKFAASLSNLYGIDKNKRLFDPLMENEEIKYTFFFELEEVYGNRDTFLVLTYSKGNASLTLAGCQVILPFNEFINSLPPLA